MAVENAVGLGKWLSCEYSITQIDRAIPRDGFNSDYSCSSPDIVAEVNGVSPERVDRYYADLAKLVLEVVEFFPAGETSLAGVQSILDVWCANCPFYKKREL